VEEFVSSSPAQLAEPDAAIEELQQLPGVLDELS